MSESEDKQHSRTALLVAGHRARLTTEGSPLCQDPWAAALAGDEGIALSRRIDVPQPQMKLWIAIRTAFLDRAIEKLMPRATQVVLLGAGLDTRAARLPRPGVRYFEVDAPASQRWKLERVGSLPGYPLEAATYASCDFEHHDFVERLASVGFDPDAPAVFVWEGVTYYLTEPAVRATLRRIAEACHPETTVLFDFVRRDIVNGELRHANDVKVRDIVANLNEPFRFGINDVLPLLYEEGFRRVRVTSFDEACLNLTGTYDRSRKFRFQLLAEASVTGPEPYR